MRRIYYIYSRDNLKEDYAGQEYLQYEHRRGARRRERCQSSAMSSMEH